MDRVHPARHPHSDKLAQKALEIVHRDFSELRDVEDERIHFSMFVNRHATGESHPTSMRSRISPGIWESFFQALKLDNANQGITVLYIEVDKPRKGSWAERLGFTKEKKLRAREKREGDSTGPELPAYTKDEDVNTVKARPSL